MPIAQICQQCGCDLARVPTTHDRTLGLAIVVCPRCRWAVARGIFSIRNARRRWNQRFNAMTYVIPQFIVGIVALFAMNGMAVHLAEVIDDLAHAAGADVWHLVAAATASAPPGWFTAWWENHADSLVATLIVTMLLGMWYRLATRHLPIWQRWLTFSAALCTPALIVIAVGYLNRTFGPGQFGRVPGRRFFLCMGTLVVLAMAGGVIGRPMSILLDRWRRQIIRSYQSRRRRKWRSA